MFLSKRKTYIYNQVLQTCKCIIYYHVTEQLVKMLLSRRSLCGTSARHMSYDNSARITVVLGTICATYLSILLKRQRCLCRRFVEHPCHDPYRGICCVPSADTACTLRHISLSYDVAWLNFWRHVDWRVTHLYGELSCHQLNAVLSIFRLW